MLHQRLILFACGILFACNYNYKNSSAIEPNIRYDCSNFNSADTLFTTITVGKFTHKIPSMCIFFLKENNLYFLIAYSNLEEFYLIGKIEKDKIRTQLAYNYCYEESKIHLTTKTTICLDKSNHKVGDSLIARFEIVGFFKTDLETDFVKRFECKGSTKTILEHESNLFIKEICDHHGFQDF